MADENEPKKDDKPTKEKLTLEKLEKNFWQGATGSRRIYPKTRHSYSSRSKLWPTDSKKTVSCLSLYISNLDNIVEIITYF